jgi:hypothetical protein
LWCRNNWCCWFKYSKEDFLSRKNGAGMSEGPPSSSIISCRWFLSPTCLFFVVMPSLHIAINSEMLAGRYAAAPLTRRGCSVRYGFINMQRNPIDMARLFPFCKNRFLSALNFIRSHKVWLSKYSPNSVVNKQYLRNAQ